MELALIATGLIAAVFSGSLLKLYSAKEAECEKLKAKVKWLQTIVHSSALEERAAPGTTKNLLDAVCCQLPTGTCAIVVVPPVSPFCTASSKEVFESVRSSVPVGTILALCHANGEQRTEKA